MEVQMFHMERSEAERRLAAYSSSLRKSRDEEYEAIVDGYRALAEGTPLVQYGVAIREAPVDQRGRPKIAVARADRTQVQFSWHRYARRASFDCTAGFRQRLYAESLLRVWVDMGHMPDSYKIGYALVPLIPPDALNAAGGRSRLSQHLVLWEVEKWSDTVIGAQPPVDPLLLRPLHGDLCAVVASWELTDLERWVMAARATA